MSRTRTTKSSDATPVSLDDTMLIADRCFGELGRNTVALWQQYNRDYFGGVLKPTPVLYVPTSPYGHWVGCQCKDANIYLMYPGAKRSWPFVRGVLLHEMVHERLSQEGVYPSHDGQPWCNEIMRISLLLGRAIWAGKYTVIKRRRANKPPPPAFDGTDILNQDQISRWPDSIGIEPPDNFQL